MINNIEDVRTELCSVYQQLKSGKLTSNEAKEMNNALGKVINASKVELEYHIVKKKTEDIKFLESK